MKTKNITPCHSRENGNPAETCVCHRNDPSEAESPHSRGWRKTYSGFTLVELLVMITILTILWTIAFTQLSGFSGSARDSDRITTLKNLESGLSLYQIKAGTYPLPEDIYGTGTVNGISLVYAWYAKDRISRFAQMNKTPVDPLSKDFYVYGTDITQQSWDKGKMCWFWFFAFRISIC